MKSITFKTTIRTEKELAELKKYFESPNLPFVKITYSELIRAAITNFYDTVIEQKN